ncbi:MAG TPA: ATP-binding cassette domain-containing protein [Pyrodictium sp.]|nr:ATP-binding cassette domain-containing protein [Pyrodictium sp.]
MPLLKLENLHVSIGGRKIIDNVSLEIESGEVHLLMGPNGAGKSTLLKAIAGVRGVEVVSGRILFEGEEITGLHAWERVRRGIVLVWQNPPGIEGVSVRELAEKISRRSGVDYRSLAEKLGVAELLDREVHRRLSGGEMRRVELFLSLLLKPKLLLVDEVDSGVDVENIARLAQVLDEVREQGVSLLIVTHSGAIASRLSRVDRLHVLYRGRLVYSGDPRGVLDKILSQGYKVFAGGC